MGGGRGERSDWRRRFARVFSSFSLWRFNALILYESGFSQVSVKILTVYKIKYSNSLLMLNIVTDCFKNSGQHHYLQL